MGFLLDKCKLVRLDDNIQEVCHPFNCGDADLDDFFQNDAMRYKKELLGKTYRFILDEDPKTIVSLHQKNKGQKIRGQRLRVHRCDP